MLNPIIPISTQLQTCNSRKTVTSNCLPPKAEYNKSEVYFTGIRPHNPIISPIFKTKYKNMVNEIKNNHLDQLKITSDLTKAEQKEFINNVALEDNCFIAFALDEKPSLLIMGENGFLKNNENYDIIRFSTSIELPDKIISLPNTLILNKKLAKETISENIELFTKRMNMNENSTADDIYTAITNNKHNLKNTDDLLGVLLGYSPINCVLYQLEKNTFGWDIDTRKDTDLYRKSLINTLLSEKSPYKNFNKEFITNISSSIRNCNNSNDISSDWAAYGFPYMNISNDEKHNQKIIKHILSTFQKGQALINN